MIFFDNYQHRNLSADNLMIFFDNYQHRTSAKFLERRSALFTGPQNLRRSANLLQKVREKLL